ncbi:MAG TPA: hypothetical protein VG651_05940 [Stellaceae bacterium]|nr:hypothetical protein [Stellaceae bacterium]
MNHAPEPRRHTYTPEKMLELGWIFYNNMKDISEGVSFDDRRISPLATFFSLSAALVEINDLPMTEIKQEDVVTRVLDTMFRGQSKDVADCLNAMKRAELVEMKDAKRTKYKKVTCLFTDLFCERLRAYTEDSCEAITGHKVSFGGNTNWVPIARAIFDYFVYRYTPEWYLLLRRILQSSGLPEEAKEELYDEVFSSAKSWSIINRYLTWRHNTPPEERTLRAFKAHLEEVENIVNSEPNDLIYHLTKIGMCEVSGPVFIIKLKLTEDVAEFEEKTLRDYESFADTVHAMIADIHPTVAAA